MPFYDNPTFKLIDSINESGKQKMLNGQLESALLDFDKSIALAKKANYNKGLFVGYLETANSYFEAKKHIEGTQYLYLAEKYATDDPHLNARINIIKGFILSDGQSYDEANKKFLATINYAKKIKDKELSHFYRDRAIINIGNIHSNKQSYDSAIYYYNLGIQSENIISKTGSILNKAEIFILQNKLDSADVYLKAGEKYLPHLDVRFYDEVFLKFYNGILALYHIKEKNFVKAKEYLIDNEIQTTFFNRNELLATTYNHLHEKDSAVYYFEKNLNENIQNKKENIKMLNAAYILHNDEKRELKTKNENRIKIYTLLTTGCALIIFLLIYIIFNREKINDQKTQLLESEKEKLRMETELSKIKEEHFQKQILSKTIQLEQKSKVLNEIKESFKRDVNFDLEKFLKKENYSTKEINNIHEIIKEIHPHFFKMLDKHAVMSLTNLDLQYAAYIYLNMTNSQIAKLLNVEPKTVSVTKYRLKQKLNLDKDTDLNTFIRNIE